MPKIRKSKWIQEEIQRFASICQTPPREAEKTRLHELGQMLKTEEENEKGPRGEPLDPSAT